MDTFIIHKHVILRNSTVAKPHMLSLPLGANIISCADQAGDWVIWEMHNTSQPYSEDRYIAIVPTGERMTIDDSQALVFIGTITYPAPFVWHVFEVVNS